MARRERHPQGEDAGKIIEFILQRKDAYYQANVTVRWKEACNAIKAGIEQTFTAEQEDLTRSKFFLSTMLNAEDASNEVYTDAYGMAEKLYVLNTKRRGTSQLTERGEWVMANIWEEAEALQSWLAGMEDINVYGMSISRQRWDYRRGSGVGVRKAKGPWGMLSTVALQNRTLWDRPYSERHHPYDWFGYWRRSDNLPWEGLQHEWGVPQLMEMLEDEEEDYEVDGVKAALARLKTGGGPKDEYFHGSQEDESWDDIPGSNTLQGYEYFGDLYGCPGHEKDKGEYHVLLTDQELLLKTPNELEGYRFITRARGIPRNDWCGGRPTLLPQVPALGIQNFLTNSGLDDIADRLYAGWAMWEGALANPDDFLNPQGIGVPVRMNKDATVNQIPLRIGGGQSGIQADMERFYNTIIERDRQASSFQDVLSQKGGIQDGTARAANLIASQGARKMKRIMIMANETGLVPIGEKLLLLKLIHTPPEDMAKQTRDGKPFELTPDELEMFLERNLWTFSDSFRRDPFLDSDNMERFAKAGGVEFMASHAADPMIPAEFWREFARNLRLRNFDRFVPLEMPAPRMQGGIPPAQGGAPPAAAGTLPEPGGEVPEGVPAMPAGAEGL